MRTLFSAVGFLVGSVALLGCPDDSGTGRAVVTDDIPATSADATWRYGSRTFEFSSDTLSSRTIPTIRCSIGDLLCPLHSEPSESLARWPGLRAMSGIAQ